MSLNVIRYAMPSGIPGAPSRVGGGVPMDIEAVILSASEPLSLYGLFGQIEDGEFRAMEAADSEVYGLLIRPFPTNATTANAFFGSTVLGAPAIPPQGGGMGQAMRVGYATVKLYGADAAVKNGIVYTLVDGEDANNPLGGAYAADDGANRIASKWRFMGAADADGNVEIVNLGNNG